MKRTNKTELVSVMLIASCGISAVAGISINTTSPFFIGEAEKQNVYGGAGACADCFSGGTSCDLGTLSGGGGSCSGEDAGTTETSCSGKPTGKIGRTGGTVWTDSISVVSLTCPTTAKKYVCRASGEDWSWVETGNATCGNYDSCGYTGRNENDDRCNPTEPSD